MESSLCPKTPACPVFNGILKDSAYGDVYKQQYCANGEEGRKKCRRFQVSTATGKCPPNILPNSIKTVDEIVAEMKKEGLI
jgi:hypothetical protein